MNCNGSKPIISPRLYDLILDGIKTIRNGEISLLCQDGHVVSMERSERLNDQYVFGATEGHKKTIDENLLRDNVFSKLDNLRYGSFVIHIRNNQVIRVERTEQQRVIYSAD